MNPLGAISSMMPPQMRAMMTQPGAMGGAGGAIPTAELQQLQSMMPGLSGIGSPANLQQLQSMMPGLSGAASVADLKQQPVSLSNVPSSSGSSFANMLGQMVQDVNAKQVAANDASKKLLTGQGGSLHEAMITMEEANISFQLMLQTRNKLLETYQELMRMQV